MAVPDNIRVFLHVAAMGDFWRETAADMIARIDASGLYDASASCHLRIVGPGSDRYLPHRGLKKWDATVAGEIEDFEYPTLRQAWDMAKREPTAKILYLHSKGVSSHPTINGGYEGRDWREKWRRQMCFHVINRWRECVALLDRVDAVGPNYLHANPVGPHFSGNFWWARASWVAGLPDPLERTFDRWFAEAWLLHKPGATWVDLYPPGLNNLHDDFLEDKYRATTLG